MIIFTSIKNIPTEILEYKGIREVKIFNLSSYFQDCNIMNLGSLLPSVEYISENVLNGDCITPEFDMQYHNYIITNDQAFAEFMNIIVPVFIEPTVLVQVLVDHSPYRDAISESLLKLIQQRYGYNAYIVNEIEDMLYTEESTFSVPGLFAVDTDLERWRFLIYNANR